MTATLSATDRYTIISADCHAGANHETYREYLDPAYLEDFDAWRNKYKNPFRDLQDGGRVRNWDNERRIGDLATRRHRRRGRVPEHGAAVLPELRAVRAAADSRAVRAPARRDPRPQPVAGRLVRRVPGTARGHRPDLPERRRRRDRRREVDQGARTARRRAHLRDPARRRLRPAAVRPGVRPPVEGLRGPRGPDQRARRHRRAQLRQVPGRRTCSSSPRSASTRSDRSCSSSSPASSSASRSSRSS